jgi:restriction endonuclease Mrr
VSPEPPELSALLQALPLHSVAGRGSDFRNPSAVARKSFDLAPAHPEYSGIRTHGSATDKRVIAEFLDRPAEMHAEAQALRAFESLRFGLPLGVADRINKLIHDLVSEPELLFAVDSREFESLVAEVLRRRGYNVEVTRQSRDGGVDIYASRIEPNGLDGLFC